LNERNEAIALSKLPMVLALHYVTATALHCTGAGTGPSCMMDKILSSRQRRLPIKTV
jgi:hypothetical protein